MIKNCPITVQDINCMEEIWGKDIAVIKGKTVQETPKQVIDNKINIPKDLYKKASKNKLHMDVIWIEGILFLIACYKFLITFFHHHSLLLQTQIILSAIILWLIPSS